MWGGVLLCMYASVEDPSVCAHWCGRSFCVCTLVWEILLCVYIGVGDPSVCALVWKILLCVHTVVGDPSVCAHWSGRYFLIDYERIM